MTTIRQNPNRARPAGNGGNADAANQNPAAKAKMWLMIMGAGTAALAGLLVLILVGVAVFGGDDKLEFDSHSYFLKVPVIAPNGMLWRTAYANRFTNSGDSNYWLRPKALNDRIGESRFHLGDEKVKTCTDNLTRNVLNRRSTKSGPVEWANYDLKRDSAAVVTGLNNVITCDTSMGILVYPGNSLTGASDIYDIVEELITENKLADQAARSPCNQRYGLQLTATPTWSEVNAYQTHEPQIKPSRSGYELTFSTYGKPSARIPHTERAAHHGNVNKYWIRTTDGTVKDLSYRYVPIGDCR